MPINKHIFLIADEDNEQIYMYITFLLTPACNYRKVDILNIMLQIMNYLSLYVENDHGTLYGNH